MLSTNAVVYKNKQKKCYHFTQPLSFLKEPSFIYKNKYVNKTFRLFRAKTKNNTAIILNE